MNLVQTVLPTLVIAGLCLWILLTEPLPRQIRTVMIVVPCADLIASAVYVFFGNPAFQAVSIYLDIFGFFVVLYGIWRKHLIAKSNGNE